MNKKREEFFDTSGVLMDCPYEVACEIWKAAQAAKIVKLEAGRERVLNSNTKVAAECEELR